MKEHGLCSTELNHAQVTLDYSFGDLTALCVRE